MSRVEGLMMGAKDWERIQQANSVHLRRFFLNVNALSVQRFGSRNEAIRRLKGQGYGGAGSANVKRFYDGLITDCKISNLQKWCLLFNVGLVEMLTIDFAAEGTKSQ